MALQAAPRSSQSTTTGTVKPATAGTVKPATAGTVKPATAGTVKPAAAGTVKPAAAGTVKPATAGTVKPATAGTVKPAAAGTVKPATAGTVKPQKTTNSTAPGSGQGPTKPVNGGASKRTGGSSGKTCCHISPGRRTANFSRNQATRGTASKSHASGNKSQHTSVPSGAGNTSGNRATGNAGSSGQATGSSSGRVPSSSTAPGKPVCDPRSRRDEKKDTGTPKVGSSDSSLVKIVVFISQGRPDCYFNRHVKAHFTSPQVPNLHETVHAAYTRLGGSEQWEVLRDHDKTENDLRMSSFFNSKMDPVWITVKKGQEMVPANIFANVSVTGREPDWNCQSFLLEGFKTLAERGYKTMQWYEDFENELLDELMEGAQ